MIFRTQRAVSALLPPWVLVVFSYLVSGPSEEQMYRSRALTLGALQTKENSLGSSWRRWAPLAGAPGRTGGTCTEAPRQSP